MIMGIQSQKTYGVFFLLLVLIVFSCRNSKVERDNSSSFEKAELTWRTERDQKMKSPMSWLTIAGLFWLEYGEKTFGTDPRNSIVLPKGSAPPFAGRFILHNGKVRVVSLGSVLKYQGTVIEEMVMKSDVDGDPDIIELNNLQMWVIERGDRVAIRLRDMNASRYKKYRGLRFFRPKEYYKLKAEFVPFSEPKIMNVPTILGMEAEMISPGYVRFKLHGKDLRLDAFEAESESRKLFIIFRDRTSGDETYGGGRFLMAQVMDDGSVDLNFNRAYNPPCAYTPYTTCPLPSPQNELPVRIEAGEKKYDAGH